MTKRKAISPISNNSKAHKQTSSEMGDVMKKLEEVMKQLEKLDKLDSIETTIKEIGTTCEDLKIRQNNTDKLTNENTANIEFMQSELEVLQSEMNRIQYDKIRNNIIIYGVPIIPDEDTYDIASKICNSLLNTDLAPDSFLTRRMPIRNISPPIVIQFRDHNIKSTIIKNWKTLNNNNNSENINIQQTIRQHLNINQNSKISITEEQTHYSHKLFREVKESLGAKFKFIWNKYGYIYIRQSEDSPIHKIETRHQLH